jgi:hypothetical protein
MSNLMSVAAAGVQAGTTRFEAGAIDVVKAAAPGAKTDLAAAAVKETTNSLALKADLQVFKMADHAMGTLLDVMS